MESPSTSNAPAEDDLPPPLEAITAPLEKMAVEDLQFQNFIMKATAADVEERGLLEIAKMSVRMHQNKFKGQKLSEPMKTLVNHSYQISKEAQRVRNKNLQQGTLSVNASGSASFVQTERLEKDSEAEEQRELAREDESEGEASAEEEDDEYEEDHSEHIRSEYVCLLCPRSDKDVKNVICHMNVIHDMDLEVLKDKYKMDHLSFVKLVNWLRSMRINVDSNRNPLPLAEAVGGLREALTPELGSLSPPWQSEKWLKPVILDDRFLQFDYETVFNTDNHVAGCDEETEYACSIPAHKALILELQDQLKTLVDQKNTMKNVVSRLMDNDNNPQGTSNDLQKITAASGTDDSYYFESYDDIGIHASMLKDLPRTGAYQRSICDNPIDFRGKTVMDLGCGTGILSMFCADTGAAMVYAIDCSNIIYEAMEHVFENDLGDKIKCHKGRLETMDLEIEKVDVIVSEFMGYFLIYEGMLSSYLYARDHFLKPNGKLFPSSAKMVIVGISDKGKYRSEIESWDRIHGFKMGAMRARALKEPAIQDIDPNTVVSEPVVVKSLDLHTCTSNDTIINDKFILQIQQDCDLTAIGGYFSVGFEDGSNHQEILSTSPSHPPTHWKQCVFYLSQKMKVAKGELVPVKLVCRPHHHNSRWLAIEIEVKEIVGTYELR